MNDIRIITEKISKLQLKEQCDRWFGDMVKLVVDVEREVIAVGGELHADAETLLLEQGSAQKNLWGANFYPWNAPDQRISYIALINIRPHQDNPSLEILDEVAKQKVKSIIETLVLSQDEELV
jgi:hypothetical protein